MSHHNIIFPQVRVWPLREPRISSANSISIQPNMTNNLSNLGTILLTNTCCDSRCECDFYVDTNSICDATCRAETAPTLTLSVNAARAIQMAVYDPASGTTTTVVSIYVVAAIV
jgi:hypothetical protein